MRMRESSWRSKTFSSLLLVAVAASLLTPGCLITSATLPTGWSGEMAKGNIMWAVCLDKPFCMDATRTSTKLVTAGPNGACPDPTHPLVAVPADRVLSPTTKGSVAIGSVGVGGSAGTGGSTGTGGSAGSGGTFFCIPDDISSTNMTSTFNLQAPLACSPNTSSGIAAHVSECIDQPAECIPTIDLGPKCGITLPPDHPPCTQGPLADETVQCAMGDTDCSIGAVTPAFTSAVQEVIAASALYGQQNPPNGNDAQRFCFTSCLDFTFSGCDPSSSIAPCDCPLQGCGTPPQPGSISTLSVPSSSMLVEIDPGTSNTLIDVRLGTNAFAVLPIAGTIALDLPQPCRGSVSPSAVCEGSLPFVNLKIPRGFSIAGGLVTDVSVMNLDNIPVEVIASDRFTEVIVAAGQSLNVTARVDGRPAEVAYKLAAPIHLVLDWSTRTLGMLDVAAVPGGNAAALIEVHGKLADLPPTADAGADQILECTSPAGAPATLSAAGSTDPDGAQDLAAFVWTTTVRCAPWELGGEVTQTPPLPLGTTHFGLEVSDRSGETSLAGTSVTVRDTAPPTFGPLRLATDCLSPADHAMHLFRLGQELSAPASDTCDDTPFVRIVNVVGDEPAIGDVRFGTGAFCVRGEAGRVERTYTVTLEASDATGNTSQRSATIRVPPATDYRPGCDTANAAPEVAYEDPRCTASAVVPVAPSTPQCAPKPPTGATSSVSGATQGSGGLAGHGAGPGVQNGGCATAASSRGDATWLGATMTAALMALARRRRRRS